MSAGNNKKRFKVSNWLTAWLMKGLITGLLLLPYRARVRLTGALVRRVIGPLAGYRKRAEKNLRMIYPDMPEAEVRRIASAVLDNFGRTTIEGYCFDEVVAQIADTPITGPGLAAFEAAASTGQPVLFTTAHFGNHDAVRMTLNGRMGHKIGGLYRPMKNRALNDFYVASLDSVGGPTFPQGKEGMRDFLAHLEGGGHLTLLFDVHFARGHALPFLGKPAMTSYAVADLAKKFGALVIPYYARRLEDGFSFELVMDAPIPHGPSEAMMTAVTRGLEDRIAAHPEQWFWVHRRWKKAS